MPKNKMINKNDMKKTIINNTKLNYKIVYNNNSDVDLKKIGYQVI